ncbi:MAG: response regulator [Nitrospirota bacterium]
MDTILVVDDDPAVRGTVGDMLSRSDYGVIMAEDGQSALMVLQERADIDLVIVDYRMPGMDGLTLVRRIKEMRLAVPVMIMTGHGDLESYLCATDLGVVRYIGKPVGLRALLRTVREAVAEGLSTRMLEQVQTGRL